eukprot:TRINITY_DN64417_c0_g1_i1.p1 TRINITY_DN64417_c0_g1~~TRINITY_DN64417_c0_g1_i1.p1  ORF type:complete len:693 (-),score=224.36 TRINITY_DN64417_c0_g1_i1:98-2176(-)
MAAASAQTKPGAFFAPAAADALAAQWLPGYRDPAASSSKLAQAACNTAVAAVAAELRRKTSLRSAPTERLETGPELVARGASMRLGGLGRLGDSPQERTASAAQEAAGAAEAPVAADSAGGQKPSVSASQAVALQLRCIERARSEAAAEVARVKSLESQAVRFDVEQQCRLELHRRLRALEKAHQEREAEASAREKAAALRLRAREEDAERRIATLRADLAMEVQGVELQRRAGKRELEAEHEKLQKMWEEVRSAERGSAEAAKELTQQRALHEEGVEKSSQAEAVALRATRLASAEGEAEIQARLADVRAEARSVALERERLAGLTTRYEAVAQGERALRAELLQAKEREENAQRELSLLRDNLYMTQEDAKQMRQQVLGAESSADAAKVSLAAAGTVQDALREEHVMQRLAARDAESLLERRVADAERKCTSLEKTIQSLRGKEQEQGDRYRLLEDALREKLSAHWQVERKSLVAQLEDGRRRHQQDAREIDQLRRDLQRVRVDFAAAEDGWWDWLRSVRTRLPPGTTIQVWADEEEPLSAAPEAAAPRSAFSVHSQAAEDDAGAAKTLASPATAAGREPVRDYRPASVQDATAALTVAPEPAATPAPAVACPKDSAEAAKVGGTLDKLLEDIAEHVSASADSSELLVAASEPPPAAASPPKQTEAQLSSPSGSLGLEELEELDDMELPL